MQRMIFRLVLITISIAVLLIVKQTIVADQSLYKKKCVTCHNLYNPDKYSKSDWIKNVNKMSSRANLNGVDKKTIINLYNKVY